MKIAYENKEKMILPAKKIANKFKWEPIINRLEKVYERINANYN